MMVKTKNKKYDNSNKRINLLSKIIIIIFILITIKLIDLTIFKHDYFVEKLIFLTNKTLFSSSTPRGRIYDRNHKLLVDNKAVKSIYYKNDSLNIKQQITLAYALLDFVSIDNPKIYDSELRDFWLIQNEDKAKELINEDEYQKYEERILTSKDIANLKRERVPITELENLTIKDKSACYIYFLMNNNYSYQEKLIKKNVTDEEYAYLTEHLNEYPGFYTKLDWERVYIYGDTFRTILGSVGKIPFEEKDEYLSNGYEINDLVGVSYLEKQYEDYLKGTKAIYNLKDNEMVLVKEGKRGNDLVLTIDIDLQNQMENIIDEELIRTKNEPYTAYYNHSFAIIQEINTGEILAMSGRRIMLRQENYSLSDYSYGLTEFPMIVGSVVKGASLLVGYNNNAIDYGEVIYDECIKIKATPKKCSWKDLGYIDDLKAIALSSNIYQFKIAYRIAGINYIYDSPFMPKNDAFSIYRKTFNEFGLGVKTNIDLPKESIGYIGNSSVGGHLLDLVMGQYDTYTPIQLSQYITTLASDGKRLQPHLLKNVWQDEIIIDKIQPKVLNTVTTIPAHLSRVQEAFNHTATKSYGLAYNYIDQKLNPYGKTGTSESFIDSDLDGYIDTETISTAFVGYIKLNNEGITITVTSPNVSLPNNYDYISDVTKRITKRITNYYYFRD